MCSEETFADEHAYFAGVLALNKQYDLLVCAVPGCCRVDLTSSSETCMRAVWNAICLRLQPFLTLQAIETHAMRTKSARRAVGREIVSCGLMQAPWYCDAGRPEGSQHFPFGQPDIPGS